MQTIIETSSSFQHRPGFLRLIKPTEGRVPPVTQRLTMQVLQGGQPGAAAHHQPGPLAAADRVAGTRHAHRALCVRPSNPGLLCRTQPVGTVTSWSYLWR